MIGNGVDPNIAIKAYSNALQGKSTGIGKVTDAGGDSGEQGGGVTFSSFLKAKVADSVDTMRGSEALSAQAIKGEADITQVVQAVTDAELTLQTVVAVRDRMVSAYQEIMRMPI